ncbi:hypothetical protein [Siccirubricoccus sp. G192]|uniref:hypothetical protein n=1 Tax=Siccirubricoccus sp. G192 TaxID=2849651 RepID=UPI001C2C96B4|nr:hypothetical protein [Siccirubricoccus sp. G192]MBV1796377.1 hypothetical protein [Siccirubricoccus sp. G192]
MPRRKQHAIPADDVARQVESEDVGGLAVAEGGQLTPRPVGENAAIELRQARRS